MVQAAPNRVAIDEFNRWAAPLDDGIARAVAGDLAVLLGTTEVASSAAAELQRRLPGDDRRPALRLVPGQEARRRRRLAVRKTGGGRPARAARRLPARRSKATGFDALAAAHSRALAKVSGDIAAAIEAASRGESANAVAADPPAASPSVRARFDEHRHTALLVTIAALFLTRPLIGDVGVGPVAFSTCMVLVLSIGLYNVERDDRGTTQRRRDRTTRRLVGAVLAALAIGERLVAFLAPSPGRYLIGSIGWLLLFAFVTWTGLRGVLRHKRVTRETISMAISTYLLIGLTWGVLYIVIFQVQPGAFNFGTTAPMVDPETARVHAFPVLVYFSLTTLATIGFGDIAAVSLQARYAAVAEGLTGQLFLAILIARLVGMYGNQPTTDDVAGK